MFSLMSKNVYMFTICLQNYSTCIGASAEKWNEILKKQLIVYSCWGYLYAYQVLCLLNGREILL